MTITQKDHEAALAQLTCSGSPFELCVEDVRGVPTRNFANRPRSMREMVVSASARGDEEFLVQGERRVGYAEFARRVWGTAAALQREGIGYGDRIAILGYNSIEYLVLVFAAGSIGAVTVALNGWWVEEEIEYALRDSGARMLVVDERLFARVARLNGTLGTLQQVFCRGAGALPAGTRSASELSRTSDEVPTVPLREDDAFVILYTSATTGRPKGCITSHRGTITQVMGILLHGVASSMLGEPSPLPSGGGQAVSLMTAPLFHVAGVHTGVCTAMFAGAKVVMTEGRFDAGACAPAHREGARDDVERGPDDAPPRDPLAARARLRLVESATHLLRWRPDRSRDDGARARGAAGGAERSPMATASRRRTAS